jgi:hypothetical protein
MLHVEQRPARLPLPLASGLPIAPLGTLRANVRCVYGFNGIITMTVVINKEGSGGGSGGYTFLGLILGAVLVVVAVVGFFMWDNYKSGGAPKAIIVTGQNK